MNKAWHIILGSASPRRKELLAELDLTFEVDARTNFEERIPEGLSCEEIPRYLAEGKSRGFHRPLEPDELLITADTLVFLGTEALGKPRDREDAVRMLRELSGKAHTVTTGVCIRTGSPLSHDSLNFHGHPGSPLSSDSPGCPDFSGLSGAPGLSGSPAMESFTDTSLVYFAELTDADIAYYVDRYQPYDKAGAYGIQEWIGAAAITRIEGSYYNVMGLPTAPLWSHLKKYLHK
ncbi:MAG: Maf family protein [Bacteroidales bacterium]|nr:Maf family protein [Bacteroidales bacterium]